MRFRQKHTVEPLSVSIIIEWDNVRLSEMDRCKAMLKQLEIQIHQLLKETMYAEFSSEKTCLLSFRGPVEVLVLYNDEEIDGSAVEKTINETIETDNLDILLQLTPAPGQHYFQLKNFGATHAGGDLIVFLDSDVIPQEGWLPNLLGSFANPEIQVVGSNAYVDPYSLYAKAFALGWFFPLPAEDRNLNRCKYFFANGVAFRRDVFTKFPFPVPKAGTRGGCSKLAETLADYGISIYQNNAARLSHPPPNGLKHFIVRSLAREGCNDLLSCKMDTLRIIRKAIRSIIRNRRRANLSLVGVPVAICIMSAYYLLYLVGEFMSHMWPNFMQKHFRV